MKLLIFFVLLATTKAAPAEQSLTFHDDGSYRFYFETGKEGGSHSRYEVRNPDGVVTGKFSYEDPDGEIREVNYRADKAGFVAQGDVGVKGAKKGQFPVGQIEEKPTVPAESSAHSVAPETTNHQPAEPKQRDNQQQSEPLVLTKNLGSDSYSYEDKDDMQDLSLEEFSASANDPPEAFPPGFFLEKFHGLRRLPEPTKEPTTTEEPPEKDNGNQPEQTDKTKDEDKENKSDVSPIERTVFSFAPVKPPFHAPASFPALPHQDWASAMFHQPVYVFAYHQPDSYGYHYYY